MAMNSSMLNAPGIIMKRAPVRQPLQQGVDWRCDAMKTAQQDDLSVEVVRLDVVRAARQALPRRSTWPRLAAHLLTHYGRVPSVGPWLDAYAIRSWTILVISAGIFPCTRHSRASSLIPSRLVGTPYLELTHAFHDPL